MVLLFGRPCLCTFALHIFMMKIITWYFGHSVFDTTAQLTEGRSARDIPIVSQGVCPKWLCPTWLHLLWLEPKVAACRHVGRLSLGAAYDLQLSMSAVPMCRLRFGCNESFVAGSFARPSSPCAPLPVSPLPCLCHDTVWLVLWLVTVLQGSCQIFVLRESAGLALFRSLTVPLLGSVPSRCRCFTLPAVCVVFVALRCLLRYWLG